MRGLIVFKQREIFTKAKHSNNTSEVSKHKALHKIQVTQALESATTVVSTFELKLVNIRSIDSLIKGGHAHAIANCQ